MWQYKKTLLVISNNYQDLWGMQVMEAKLKIAHKEHKLTKIKQSLNTDTDLDTQT